MKKCCEKISAVAVTLAVLFIIAAPVFAEVKAPGSPVEHSAESVLVMDARTGEVLFESEGFASRYPASITKIMTALIVLEMTDDLTEPVFISAHAADLPHYAGRLGLLEGESLTVLEALYALVVVSANDVARALAEHFAGSEAEFVELMNRRAVELGARYTNFINPCGLPGGGQFTTAYDIALIMRAAVRNPLFVEIIATPYFTLPPTEEHDEPRELRNSNAMVRPSREEFNPYVVGGKTGFTNAAQHTLVSYALRDEHELIISVLHASPRGAIFADTAALMDFIFYMEAEEYIPVPDPEPEITIELEIFEEPEKPAEEPEALAVFLYIEQTPEISTADAAVTAALSVVTAAAALVLVFFVRKKL